MTSLEQLAKVVRMACQIEDRDRSFQSALLAVAHSVDKELNANVVGNRRFGHFAGSMRATLEVPMSRLAREAGCPETGCKVCEKATKNEALLSLPYEERPKP